MRLLWIKKTFIMSLCHRCPIVPAILKNIYRISAYFKFNESGVISEFSHGPSTDLITDLSMCVSPKT